MSHLMAVIYLIIGYVLLYKRKKILLLDKIMKTTSLNVIKSESWVTIV